METPQNPNDYWRRLQAYLSGLDRTGTFRDGLVLWAKYSIPGLIIAALSGATHAGMFGMGVMALLIGCFWIPKHEDTHHLLSIGGLCLLVNGLFCVFVSPLILTAVAILVTALMMDDDVEEAEPTSAK